MQSLRLYPRRQEDSNPQNSFYSQAVKYYRCSRCQALLIGKDVTELRVESFSLPHPKIGPADSLAFGASRNP